MKTLLIFTLTLPMFAVTVSTAQYDNTRNGVNTTESILTPANVNTVTRLGTYVLDGPMYSQPLYIPSLTIATRVYNVLYAVTANNTVYALDADNPGAAPLWSTNFGAGWSTYPTSGGGFFYGNTLGILSTPVIDVSGGFLYLVSTSSAPVYTLRKINLTTGTQVSSVAIAATVSGTGTGSGGGLLPFNPALQTQRTPLTLANGNVYFGFGSIEENTHTWHGWVFSYDTATLTQQAVLCLSPNGNGAGIWESSGGFAVDGSGNLYFATGNGDFDGTSNFSQTIVKVNSSLVIQDWFTPANNATTSAEDADVSSGRAMLIPSTSLLTVASKDARVWVINTSSMGHLQGSGTAPQVFTITPITTSFNTGVYGGLFFGSVGYFPVAANPMFAFTFSGSTFTTTALASTSPTPFAQAALTGSSNSGSDPIVWALAPVASAFSSAQQVILHAFNPSTLAEYWNSGVIGNYAKFVAPTVANGRVYAATNNGSIVAFGLPTAVVAVSVTGIPLPAKP